MISNSKNKLTGTMICNYTLKEFIGQGSYSQVYRALALNDDVVAIKIIPDNIFSQNQNQEGQYLLKEINTMNSIRNPNVVKIQNYIQLNGNHYIVMEYCDGGNLSAFLDQKNNPISEEVALSIFKQILNGIQGLHEEKCIHKGLRLDNIFVHQGNQVKIGDLGFSKKWKREDNDSIKPIMAPEIVKQQSYGKQADIFQMGVILFQLLYGRKPLSNKKVSEFLIDIQKNDINFERNPAVSQEIKELLKSMLKEDPKQRITFRELYKNHLFAPKDISQQSINGLNRFAITADEINYKKLQNFYENQSDWQYEATIEISNTAQNLIQHQIENKKLILSNGVGIIDQSDSSIQQQQQQQVKQQQNFGPRLNTYITPRENENLEFAQFLSPPPDPLSIEDEQLVNELIQTYYDRFISIQYLLRTLNEIPSVTFPIVFPIIYPQLILQKKAIVEFKEFRLALSNETNIFKSPVFDKILGNKQLIQLNQKIKEYIEHQEMCFINFYKPSVDENLAELQRFLQIHWLMDNQIEPSEYFNQNYNEALQLILQIVQTLIQKQPPEQSKLEKIYSHLKRCLDFQQLLQDKVNLEIEFS